MSAQPEPVAAVVDHDKQTVTIAVTLRWNPEWSIDKCEVLPIVAVVRTAIENGIIAAETDKVLGFSYTCWDPNEELEMGYLADYQHPVCAGCGKPVKACNSAPEGWVHAEVIPLDEPCDRLSGRYDGPDPYVVNFPNLLDRTFLRPLRQV